MSSEITSFISSSPAPRFFQPVLSTQMFDYNNEGRISLSGIQQLHEKLGEPLTDEEAADVIRSLDRDGSGLITFDKVYLSSSNLRCSMYNFTKRK